jgi:hypothetical protein
MTCIPASPFASASHPPKPNGVGAARPPIVTWTVGARDVDLQHAILEVALLVERRQHPLIFRRHVLRAHGPGGWADDRHEGEREVPRQSHGILQV